MVCNTRLVLLVVIVSVVILQRVSAVPAKYHVHHKRHHKKHKKYEKRSPAMGDRDKRQNWVTVQLGRDGKTPMFYLDSKPPPDLLKAQPMILG